MVDGGGRGPGRETPPCWTRSLTPSFSPAVWRWADGDGKGRRPSDPRHPGTGRQKSLHRHGRRRPGPGRPADRLWQAAQLRADLCGARLPAGGRSGERGADGPIKAEIRRQYGPRPLQNPAYGRIVNQKHFRRLCGLLDGASQVWGGGTGRRRMAHPRRRCWRTRSPREPAMQEEIFGPLLPVLSYRRLEEALTLCAAGPSPWPSTVHPQPCGPQPGGAYRALWGRLRQRHNYAPVRPLPALWRSGAERDGQLPRQAQLRHPSPMRKACWCGGSLDLPSATSPTPRWGTSWCGLSCGEPKRIPMFTDLL